MMENIYPASPQNIPAKLTSPRRTYKQRAILAMAGLLLFVVLYCLLAGWFIWTAYRLFSIPRASGEEIFFGILASFLAVFMVKPLFRVKHNHQSNDLEISPDEEPKLFEFLYRLADEAKAPRPYRVFLSPRVNAGVFYDVSIINLFFPSKKNLEIGLGLVNVLTLGEMKAVLAHEFGHFAQRSMAVGRWVYIAQQIAAHIVTERDALDRVLRFLSRMNPRIAWIGWLLSLVVWSIRSLLETVFGWLMLAQRALSREMEFQADLVAVSLTGSDALIHALHRLHAADDAWERTLSFASSEIRNGRLVADLFVVQTAIIEKMRGILNNADYGWVPQLPDKEPENHRLFQAELTEPPRMWATHPPNADREENAKRIYIPVSLDDRSAWILFDNPQALREKMSDRLFQAANESAKAGLVSLEVSREQLNRQFDRRYFDRSYRGAYLGRSIVCHAANLEDLYDPQSSNDNLGQNLTSLYPESLSTDLEKLRVLEKEKGALEALRDRRLQPAGGILKHRGKSLQRQDLPNTIEDLERELTLVRQRVFYHDRLCRTTHRAIAAHLGNGWEAYLLGLLRVLHYADHTEANLQDVRGYLANVLAVVTADRHVSYKEMQRLLAAADEVYDVLAQIYKDSDRVRLHDPLSQTFNGVSWSAALGEFKLPPPSQYNITEWMNAIDGWIGVTAGALSALKLATLEQLLHSEALVADAFRQSKQLDPAPTPSRTPATYAVLLLGQERKRQTRLGWWDRFQTADGFFPEMLRFLVAGGTIASVLWAGATMGN